MAGDTRERRSSISATSAIMDLSGCHLETLRQDRDFILYRGHLPHRDGSVLVLAPASRELSSANIQRLEHELALANELDNDWAAKPLALTHHDGRTVLLLDDAGGRPIGSRTGKPPDRARFLEVAIGLASALRQLHRRGLVHTDIKPANILVDDTGRLRITGFGLARYIPRERQTLTAPIFVSGSFAYMAPEQTGCTNRSIDARTDLYAAGVTLYELLTGSLPFIASDPEGWKHAHVAKTPAPLRERVPDIPLLLEAIILKLLAKTAEERYQTALGLEHDLRRCQNSWKDHARIDSFPLGSRDWPDRLLIPEKLYGREAESTELLHAYSRVIKRGGSEIVIVSGEAGVGKSSFVHELQKNIFLQGGILISGKADPHGSAFPYAVVAHAIKELVGRLLLQDSKALAQSRAALIEALGPNGQLVINLAPDLSLLIGKQAAVQNLSGHDERNRLHLVIKRFLGVFAKPNQPLVLFLDDLQWLDPATADLLERLALDPDVKHLLLVGAYRPNEVGDTHPLSMTLKAIEGRGKAVTHLGIGPLSHANLQRLIGDTLRCSDELSEKLTDSILEKTGGNPFFVVQLLTELVDEGLLAFDATQTIWKWDSHRERTKAISDNIVDFLTQKLNDLPVTVLDATKIFACLGGKARTAVLATVLRVPVSDIDVLLKPAVNAGLITCFDGNYVFVHDRIQEAAYAFIQEAERPAEHLRIGLALRSVTPDAESQEDIFDIVNQLNRGSELLHSQEECVGLAELNLAAGRRARSATAFSSALIFLAKGRALLGENSWDRHYRLNFDLEFLFAECEFLAGNPSSAADRLSRLYNCALGRADQATVARLRIALNTTINKPVSAIEVGLEFLRSGALHWSLHPTDQMVAAELDRMNLLLVDRPIEALIDLPAMTDPEMLTMMAVLGEMSGPTFFTDYNLFSLVTLHMANLSLAYGNCDFTPLAYTLLNIVLGVGKGEYRTGIRFGQLGCDLVDRRSYDRFRARVYMQYGNWCVPWATHLSSGQPLMHKAIGLAQAAGDLTYEGYARLGLIANILSAGMSLADAQREAEIALSFARAAHFGLIADCFVETLILIRDLRGVTNDDGLFEEPWQDRKWFRQHLIESDISLGAASVRYWTHQLQRDFIIGDNADAIAASKEARRFLTLARAYQTLAEYHFYSALALAASCDNVSAEQRRLLLSDIEMHRETLANWSQGFPPNFAHRVALISAEIARIESKDLDAGNLYEESIQSAQKHGFLQNAAIANELAARFYRSRGLENIADTYLREARQFYARWGANRKVQQLDLLYPHLQEVRALPDHTAAIATSVEHLDLATVIKISQAISDEIVLEKLIDTIMRTAIEQAGAARGLLILLREGQYRIVAEATTTRDAIAVILRQSDVTPYDLPESILHYVLRTKESVLLNDALRESQPSDDYIRRHRARSVLCLPLLKQGRMLGLLYLENNLAPHVFTPAGLSTLRLLASQAAISLENSRLYADLQEREARVRRLVDSNIAGIFIWDLDGHIIEANDAFLRMMGYDQSDVATGQLRWTDLMPAWSSLEEKPRLEELKTYGRVRPFEGQYSRRDGSLVPALIGLASFEKGGDQGVAFVLDLSEQRRAEAEARENEQRYRVVQMELAHANRVATLGQLSASITHEVNQPLSGVVTSAETAALWLSSEPPNLEEARLALARVVRDGERASEVVRRIRALIKKAPPQWERLAINDAILDVIRLMQGELRKGGISVHIELAEDLPLIQGDRIQLQQVILNLTMNAAEAMAMVAEGSRDLLISTTRGDPDGVRATVKDTGPGVEEGDLERIFNTFYTTKANGLGMGLAICRSIIDAHGGKLRATRKTSSGATFEFDIPTSSKDR